MNSFTSILMLNCPCSLAVGHCVIVRDPVSVNLQMSCMYSMNLLRKKSKNIMAGRVRVNPIVATNLDEAYKVQGPERGATGRATPVQTPERVVQTAATQSWGGQGPTFRVWARSVILVTRRRPNSG
jgi:hypothetical protein